MPKVNLSTRLKVLHEMNEIFDNQCATCPYNQYFNYQNEMYCRTKCEHGQKLQELGEQYCGFVFKRETRDIDKDQCIQMYQDGFYYHQIADYFGVSKETIRTRLREWGYARKKNKEGSNGKS